jgi:flagella basal body P-ring formation protein FlgA
MNRHSYSLRGLLISFSALSVILAGCGTDSPSVQAGSSSGSAVVPSGTPSATAPAVVAITDIVPGTRITADMLAVKNYTLGQDPVYVVKAPEQAVNKFAAISILRGQAIYLNMIVSVPPPCKPY